VYFLISFFFSSSFFCQKRIIILEMNDNRYTFLAIYWILPQS
jgi:hypothetical protein